MKNYYLRGKILYLLIWLEQIKSNLLAFRMQINITNDIERKSEELLDILSRQSPDLKVTISELMQALILNIYDARDNIRC